MTSFNTMIMKPLLGQYGGTTLTVASLVRQKDTLVLLAAVCCSSKILGQPAVSMGE